MANVLFEFRNYPREREIVGKLLIAYGEIEFALLSCLRQVLDNDVDTATRILFRVKGEGARIEVADAIMRPAFMRRKLGGKWSGAIGAARKCKAIRNQYAHCHWQLLGEPGKLYFLNLDIDAQAAEGPIKASHIPLLLSLLEKQETYFVYALDCLYYLEAEYKKLAGRSSSHDQVWPKSIPAPPPYIQPKKAPQSRRGKASGS